VQCVGGFPLTVPMINTKVTTWMVRAGSGSDLLPQFLNRGLVSLGWSSAGDLAGVHTRDEIKALVVEAKPEKTSAQAGRIAGCLHRFRNGIKPGHNVVTYDSDLRTYHIGIVEGEYEFNLEDGDPFAHRIAVRWTGKVERDALDMDARKPLGALISIFKVPASALTPKIPSA
jgi:restriction system protein